MTNEFWFDDKPALNQERVLNQGYEKHVIENINNKHVFERTANKERAWAEIDLDAISANIGFIRDRIGPKVKLMAVVKADGYGHGLIQVSRAALGLTVGNAAGGGGAYGAARAADFLGVAIIDEALELRANGIKSPILVLGHTPESWYREAVCQNISLAVYELGSAKKLSQTALEQNKKAAVHIKINTGMNRLGFNADEKSVNAISEIITLPGLYLEGIFTHFASSDSPNRAFTYEQAKHFESIISGLNIRPTVIHAANSAATLYFNDFFYDMVRVGIAVYGLSPRAGLTASGLSPSASQTSPGLSPSASQTSPGLKPALSLYARISQIRRLRLGESVGYGRTFTASRESAVAIVQIGYADGYPRILGNKAQVLIKGRRAPVVGTVCMDQLMIDITGIDGVASGDIVTLIGADGGETISAEELAALTGTINYEIVCGFSKRIPRIYI